MKRITIRRPAIFFGLAFGLAFPAVLRCQTDEEAIRTVLSTMEEAWNRGDAKGWAAYYMPDAELVDVAGAVLDGRDRIEGRHADLLGGMLNGSRISLKLRRVRFLQPDVAVVDTDVDLYGYKTLPKGFPVSGAVLSARLKHVMVHAIGKWWIVASQNTYVPPPPPPE